MTKVIHRNASPKSIKISRDRDTIGHIGSTLKSAIAINLRRTSYHICLFVCEKIILLAKKNREASDVRK